MDRLSAVVALVAIVACEDKPPAGDPPSRVNAAKTTQRQTTTVDAFCDVYAAADVAKSLRWPALVEPAPKAAAGWRWINVWATWCKPCIEEMPRLVQWQGKLGGPSKLDLVFVSVDETADEVVAFRTSHPETPASFRLADSKTQESWYAQLGLQGSPPIPIHVVVDPQQRVRCVRAGGVRDQDFPTVVKLLAR